MPTTQTVTPSGSAIETKGRRLAAASIIATFNLGHRCFTFYFGYLLLDHPKGSIGLAGPATIDLKRMGSIAAPPMLSASDYLPQGFPPKDPSQIFR
jgi:hypothetical protein